MSVRKSVKRAVMSRPRIRTAMGVGQKRKNAMEPGGRVQQHKSYTKGKTGSSGRII